MLEDYLEKSSRRGVYSNLIQINLNSISDQLNQYTNYFDKIILCDVLEHLNDPMNTLKQLSNCLKENGEILIDIPNIAHGSIKYKLLINEFQYQDYGLLDKTHIKFFTPFSLIDALSENNFFIENMDFVINHPNDGLFPINYDDFNEDIIKFIEEDKVSYIFQIFAVAKKSNLKKIDLIKHNNLFKKFNNLEDRINEYLPNFLDNKFSGIENESNEIYKLKNEIQLMKNSNSWKITSPLRAFFKFIKKIFARK